MRWIEDAWGRTDLPSPVVATVGNYDGVHVGQRAILSRVVARADAEGLPAAVVTFEPHPLRVLRPDEAPRRISTAEQKRELLEDAGIDVVAVVRFDETLACRTPEEFVDGLLVEGLGVRELYVGSRFVFGRDRSGDVEALRRLGATRGFEAHGVEEVDLAGEPVSSTRIRQALERGEVATARRLLGRPFDILGTIVPGDDRGAALGWPTINLATENELLPANGVYTTTVRFAASGAEHAGVTNVGVRPTFGGSATRPVVESHILDFNENVYGERVRIAFLERQRAEETFSSAQALSRQIGLDVAAARRYFSD
ncbi:MAG: bifunctional riboflavin kinase/FAD synthetase [Thermoanaerobaculia bacterium]